MACTVSKMVTIINAIMGHLVFMFIVDDIASYGDAGAVVLQNNCLTKGFITASNQATNFWNGGVSLMIQLVTGFASIHLWSIMKAYRFPCNKQLNTLLSWTITPSLAKHIDHLKCKN